MTPWLIAGAVIVFMLSRSSSNKGGAEGAAPGASGASPPVPDASETPSERRRVRPDPGPSGGLGTTRGSNTRPPPTTPRVRVGYPDAADTPSERRRVRPE